MPPKKVGYKKQAKKAYSRKSAPVKVSKSVQAYVKKAIHVQAENRIADPLVQSNIVIQPMNIGTWGSLFNLSDVWLTQQGSAQGERSGNSISPMKWRIRGAMFSAPTSLIPMVVRMFIFRRVDGYTLPNLAGVLPVDFFQNGNLAIPPQQTMADTFRYVNKDKYKVYTSKIFKVGVSNTAGYHNNDFGIVNTFDIDLMKGNKHKIKFNDASSIPENQGLYMAFTACRVNDSAIAINDLRLVYDVYGEYEDL